MPTMPLTMNLEQSTYLQRLKDAYYASYGELKGDGKYRYRLSIADLIDKANLELKYIWENPNGI